MGPNDGTHSETPCRHSLSRRQVLGVTGGIAAGAGLASLLGAAPASAVPGRPDGSLRFGAVSDTHISIDSFDSATWLTRVYASMAKRDPDAVLHCGDVTDTGLAEEFDLYAPTVPDALKGLIHYTPGNHETRWDPTAKERYHAHFGPTPYSFDLGGLHVIGFDPTEILQEPGHYGESGLTWLRNDLARLHPGTPALLFQHFPFGNKFYYVDDQPEVLQAFEGMTNLKVIVAGHIHKEDVSTYNGISQVALNAVKNGPYYYWFERAAQSQDIVVTRVTVAEDGTETEAAVATIPLGATDTGRELRPASIQLGRVSAGTLPVTVDLGQATTATAEVRPFPQAIFGGEGNDPWQPLSGTGRRVTGQVDVAAIAAGAQRLEVRVRGTAGDWWQQTVNYDIPRSAGDPSLLWQFQLPGSIQGGVTLVDGRRGLLAAASTTGDVVLFDARGRQQWHTKVGAAYRRPVLDQAGRLLVPSADHHLYALDSETGRRLWAYNAGAPVLSVPGVGIADGSELITFSAGESLITIDAARAEKRWSIDDRGFSSGQVAIDGGVVYSATADGYARAHDLGSGEQLWAFPMVTGDAHRIALYSGWDDVVAAGDGIVVVATVSNGLAIDAATGAQRWKLSGSTMYAPSLIIGDAVLLTTEYGVVSLVDAATGSVRWTTNLALRVFNAGVALQDDVAWVVSVDGKTIGLNLADGSKVGWLQHSLVYNFGRPVVVGNTLVVGDQNGIIRGLRLP